jgi:phosphatidate cytidylyltransferase
MKQRILTALVLAPIAIAIILLAPTALFAAIVALAFLLAAWEWTRLVGVVAPGPRALYVVVAGALMGLLWSSREGDAWAITIALGLAWWLASLVWLRHFSFAASPTPRNRALKLAAGFAVLIPAWVALVDLHRIAPLGQWWTLFALVLVWAADTFAYFTGSRFGRVKLAPRISPGKTIEGAWGALIGGALVAVAGGWLLGERDLALVLLVAVAVLTLVFSIVGDLLESLLKRQANVKDSGTLFPGHGGLLDRLDSVFAAMPVFAAGKAMIDLLLPA